MNTYVIVKRVMISLLAAISVTLFILNLALLRRNRLLSALAEAKYTEAHVQPGTIVPLIRGVNLQGDPIAVDPGGMRNTLLMVFTTTCPFCKKNWTNWESLIKNLDKHDVNMVLIDLSAGVNEAYLQAHLAEGLTTIAQLDPAMLVPYKLGSVPETILIGPDARVKNVWIGVLEPKDTSFILKACAKSLAEAHRDDGGTVR